MKKYFPLTDYEFYAYLTSGGFVLAISDFTFNHSRLLSKGSWTVIQIIIAISAAYIVGHIIAMFAQTLLETIVMKRLFSKPMEIQLGLKEPGCHEKILGFFIGRYYDPLSPHTQATILSKASESLGCTPQEISNCEDVFRLGFQKSFESKESRKRIDDFRNQYGLCRNIAFVALLALIVFAIKAYPDWSTTDTVSFWVALTIFISMFIRYVKFLSCFQLEVIKKLL